MQIQLINIDENKENEMFLADWAPSMQGTPAKKNAYKENGDVKNVIFPYIKVSTHSISSVNLVNFSKKKFLSRKNKSS